MFRESARELKDSHTMVVIAMLLALAVVLGFFGTVQVTDFLKIGFSFLPNELAAMLFGPSVGGIVAGAADILKYLVKPTGAFSRDLPSVPWRAASSMEWFCTGSRFPWGGLYLRKYLSQFWSTPV